VGHLAVGIEIKEHLTKKMMCHSEECNDEESQSPVPSLEVEIPLFARNDSFRLFCQALYTNRNAAPIAKGPTCSVTLSNAVGSHIR
jgi:hypothetical protein